MSTLPNFKHFGGTHWETAALKNALAYCGVNAPHTGKPLSEAMCLGISGGIAAGVSLCPSVPSWHKKLGAQPPLKPDAPFEERYMRMFCSGSGMSVIGRYHAFSTGADKIDVPLRRLGCKTTVKETGGAKGAQQNLIDGLSAGRPVFLWVGTLKLDWSGAAGPCGMYTVLCHGIDEAKGEALLGDRGPDSIRIALDELAFLRNRVCSFKNRSLTFEPPKKLDEKTLKSAVAEGIAACAADFRKPKLGTFNLPGLLEWSKVIASEKNRKGWPNIYGVGPQSRLYVALRDAFRSIETAGTGGGLLRGLYAEFLDQAAAILGRPALKDASEAYRSLATQWTALAEACLPDAVKPLKQTKALLRKRMSLFTEKGTKAEKPIRAVADDLAAIEAEMCSAFPLSKEESIALLTSLSSQIAALHAAESAASALLEK